jgi:hypothetical protein
LVLVLVQQVVDITSQQQQLLPNAYRRLRQMLQQSGVSHQYRAAKHANMAPVAAAASNRVLGVLLQQHSFSSFCQ